MTRNHQVSKAKIIGTIVSLVVFVVLIANADKLTSTASDMGYINPAFVGDGGKDVTINMDTFKTTIDDTDEGAIVQYIVQENDTLEKIASRFGTTVSNIKKINEISSIQPGQKLVVTDEEDGIIYTVRETQNIKVFANKYGLNLEDLMTLNYITDTTEILQKGQEVFINVSAEKANAIPGFIDKGQPNLNPPVVKPKPVVATTRSTTTVAPTTTSSTATVATPVSQTTSQRTFTKNISNGFARGYCTWYVATQMKNIFPYTSETTQSRPFAGDAKYRYTNAKSAGLGVGQSPRAGAIIVYGSSVNPAGHVGIVKSVDTTAGTMVIEDMNYKGKFVVTRRIESTSRSGIIGYIYG
ncbi:MAG: LysM peptidoglycan-binding domain-containing protein [Candidatus Peribacteria bacterium]|jgi:surface antigen|nr:LysM peptidoglycan-binding domain-containing protein [Candidatus Peribacteria bacterium]